MTELKIPAQAPFVMVAKRAAGALGSTIGFSLADIDDINIAVAQACEKAIAASDRIWGPGNGILKLTFRLVGGGMQVDVRSLPARLAGADERNLKREAELERRADEARRAAARLSQEVEVERSERLRAQGEARLLRAQRDEIASRSGRQVPVAMSERDLEDAAVNMIRLFVDELRYNVDSQGSMRMRMVKYLVE